MRKIVAIFVALLNYVLWADTHTAANCFQTSVIAAIDSASDGDIVEIPAGSATWTSPVVISSKAITLKGQGVSSTVITDGTPVSSWNGVVALDGVAGKPIRVTGIAFLQVNDNGICITGTCKNWRIDHCKIETDATSSVGRAINVDGYTYGLIDSCQIICRKSGASLLVIEVSQGQGAGWGVDSWNRPLSLGTIDAVYMEDCIIDNNTGALGVVTDGGCGGRFVVRHCRITNFYFEEHGIETGSEGDRGLHSFEIYANVMIDNNMANCYRFAYLRGGTGVIYDNIAAGNWGGIQLAHYCIQPGRCSGFEACSAYPCMDQIGRSTDSDSNGVQDSEPLYIWNNKNDGSDIDVGLNDFCSCGMDNYIKQDRDYYINVPRPGYKALTYPHPLREEPSTTLIPIKIPASNHNQALPYTVYNLHGQKICITTDLKIRSGNENKPYWSGICTGIYVAMSENTGLQVARKFVVSK